MIRDMLAPLADHLWQSTVFAAVVGLLTLALRHNRAAIRYALWFAASAKFLVPFSLLVAVGSQFQRHAAAVITPGGLPVAIDQMFAPPVFHGAPDHPMVSTASAIPAVILAVWALGFAAVLFSWWRAWRPIRAALRRATPLRLPVAGLPTFLDVRYSPDLLEPAVIGIWRPVLLLPDGITDRLMPSEMQAILAHELCHIRRHDNLAAMMQMLVEALFWFHPLVWWLEARLVDERERACDEEVLRSGNDPVVYAESILKICRFYLHSQLACASRVSGANLKKRVEEIMINRVSIRMNAAKKLLLVTSAAVVVALPLVAGLGASHQATAQSQASADPRPQARAGTPAQAAFASRIAVVSPAGQDATAMPVVTASPAVPAGPVVTASQEVTASPAVPASPAVEWVTYDDYPKSALREGRQGKTAIRLTVGIDGRAKECFVTTSSGSPDLDEAACDTLLKRARFNPATDDFGKPREGLWIKEVNWVLPKD